MQSADPHRWTLLGIALLATSTAMLLGGAGAQNGDAAVYASQVVSGDVTARPAHLGYLLMARVLWAGWPGDPSRLLDTLSALALGAVTWSAGRLAGRNAPLAAAGIAAALALPAAPFGEVDLPLAAGVALAAAVRAPAGSALWFGLACAISPAALVWAPAVALLRRQRGVAAWTPVAGGLLWLAAVAPWWGGIAFGPRGIAAAATAPLPWVRAVRDGLVALLPGAVSPLVIVGAVATPTTLAPALLAFVPAALSLDRVPGVAGQLATIPFVAVLAAQGVGVLRRRWPGPGGIAAALLVGAALAEGFREADVHRWEVQRETEELVRIAGAVRPGEAVVASWGWGQRYARVAGPEARWSRAPPSGVAGFWLLPPGTTMPGPYRCDFVGGAPSSWCTLLSTE